MKTLSILYVDTEGVWRGGQEQLFSLMTGLKRKGHRVELAVPLDAPLGEKARQAGVPIYEFRQRGGLSLLAFLRLWFILRKGSFDIIHFNTPRAIVMGGLASRLCRTPVRISSRRVNFPLRTKVSHYKYNWMQENVVTVSLSIRRTLLEGGVRPELVTVIYEGVDVNWIDQQRRPLLLRPMKGPVVGTVAHLSEEKGHHILLKAAACLAPQFPEVTFLLVGEGELEQDLKKSVQRLGIEKQVVFAGFRSDSEAWMRTFDIFCLPSRSEGLSSAILAAMASQLPVIATRVGGIPELVVDGETGFLVSANHPQELVRALDRLLRSRNLCRRMGQAGRRRVQTYFTLDRKLDKTEKLYRKLLRARGFS